MHADRLGLLHDPALGVALLGGRHVEGDGIEDPELELRREVGHQAEGSEGHHVGRHREVGHAEDLGQLGDAEEDRHGLLGPDHGDGDHRDARTHGDLDEAAATETPEAVAIGVRLGGPLRPFGEDEHQLPLVSQDPDGVVGMGRDTTDAGPHGAHPRRLAEEVVGQTVDGPTQLLFDAVHDDGGVGGDGAGVVGHQERATGPRDLLEPFPFDPEPVFVEGRVDLPGQTAHVLGPAPLVHVRQAVTDDRSRRRAGGGGRGRPAARAERSP